MQRFSNACHAVLEALSRVVLLRFATDDAREVVPPS
jgi:hypothetical protein